MKRSHVALLGAVVAVAVAAWLWVGRSKPHAASSATSAAGPTAGASAPRGRVAAMQLPTEKDGAMAAETGTARLEVLVTDEQGQPVAGAEVGLAGTPIRRGVTTEDGSFSFDGLAPGELAVTATRGERIAFGRARVAADGGFVLLTLRADASLALRVTSAQGPVAGATVTAHLPLATPQTTDAAGLVVLRGHPDGWLGFSVVADGFAPHHAGARLGRGKREQTLELVRGVTLAGRVVDQAGAGVPDVALHIGPPDEQFSSGATRPGDAVSAADGAFSLVVAVNDDLRLSAKKLPFEPGRSDIISTAEQDIKDVVITLRPGLALRGRVTDAGGAPVANATVSAWGDDALRRVTSNGEGAFAIEGLAAGKLGVRATHDVGMSEFKTVELAAGAADVVLTLRPGLEISGRLVGVDPVEGMALVAVPAARLMLASRSGGDVAESVSAILRATADADGRFTFRGAAPEAYILKLADSGFGETQVSAKGGDTNIEFAVPAMVRVTGKVQLADGTPVDGRIVIGMHVREMFEKGDIVLPYVPVGTHVVRLFGTGFEAKHIKDVVIGPGAFDLGTIVVSGGREVRGKVIDGKGNPVADAGISLGRAELAAKSKTRSAADGTFVLGGLSERDETIYAGTAQAMSHGGAVPSGKASVSDMVLRLAAVGHLRGTLKREDAAAGMATLAVQATGTEGRTSFQVQVSPEGQFVARGLPEGAYAISLSSMDPAAAAVPLGTVKIKPGVWNQVNLVMPAR